MFAFFRNPNPHRSVSPISVDGEQTNRPKRRRGFTIVETITVAAICSVWLAVATPYVQSVREKNQKIMCKNHLKALGLAMHHYHDVYRTFPPGWISEAPKEKGPTALGWAAFSLPFNDNAPLFMQLDQAYGASADLYGGTPKQTALLKQELSLYRCPADSLSGTNSSRGGWGTSNYVGNFGSRAIPRKDPLSADGPDQAPTLAINTKWKRNKNKNLADGIMAVNSHVRIRDITDGISNTIMLGERSATGKGAIWPGPRSNFNESDVVADGSFNSKLNQSATSYSSKHHDGTIYILLCDGAVRAITEKIDSKKDGKGILQKLSARNDSLLIGEF